MHLCVSLLSPLPTSLAAPYLHFSIGFRLLSRCLRWVTRVGSHPIPSRPIPFLVRAKGGELEISSGDQLRGGDRVGGRRGRGARWHRQITSWNNRPLMRVTPAGGRRGRGPRRIEHRGWKSRRQKGGTQKQRREGSPMVPIAQQRTMRASSLHCSQHSPNPNGATGLLLRPTLHCQSAAPPPSPSLIVNGEYNRPSERLSESARRPPDSVSARGDQFHHPIFRRL